MSPQADPGNTPVTSLDLLRELQGEQKAFRFLIRALAVLLVTAAVIAVGSVIYFYVALQGLKSEYAYQARLNEINLRIVAGEASRQRESTQAQLVAIREENESARRQAELSRELQQAGSARLKKLTARQTGANAILTPVDRKHRTCFSLLKRLITTLAGAGNPRSHRRHHDINWLRYNLPPSAHGRCGRALSVAKNPRTSGSVGAAGVAVETRQGAPHAVDPGPRRR